MKLPKSLNKEVVLLGVLIFILSLGQLQRIAVPWGAQYAHELVLFFYLFTKRKVYARILLKTWKESRTNTKILVALIISGVLLQSFTSGDQRGLLLTFRAFLYTSTAWTIYLSVATKQKELLRLFLLTSGVVMAIMGVIQYLFLPDMRFLAVLGWDDHYYRAIGSMLDPNYFGILLVLTLANLWSWGKRIPAKLTIALTVLLSMTIAATISRATFLAVTIFFVTQFLRNKKIVSLAAGILLITLLALPKPTGEGVDLLRTSSINSRISHDQEALGGFELNPIKMLFGTGLFSSVHPSTFADKSIDHGLQANNIFVFLYQGIGLVGMLLLLPILLKDYKIVYQKEHIIAFALVALLVHAQFNNSFFEPIVFSYWVLLVATLKKTTTEK
ncbi:MAG: hypothetical protein GW947_03120 [Candidatus Pacebacteria bacterium]|nr:hypothetical protein [Candidatus Paceibacterota bacterium]PIR60407.1 MAG: hypothetical protein COU68_02640 [Candidatus Pacebacteria bacterium CG10_big_fil_rev_8_21_14_0_10_45_6]